MGDAASETRRITPAEGLAIAREVYTLIDQEQRAGGTVHLLGAIPFGVALMIGWQLQSVGKIQCYELHRTEGMHIRTHLLNTF